jgi:hypothetical protein
MNARPASSLSKKEGVGENCLPICWKCSRISASDELLESAFATPWEQVTLMELSMLDHPEEEDRESY